jgi:hypothetical protein
VSRWTTQREIKRLGYKSTLPYGTPMLTQEHRDARGQCGIKHQNDDWSRPIFNDETYYQLFRNAIRRWREFQNLKSIELRRTDRRLWYGMASASRA